jgi:hypothetical protein
MGNNPGATSNKNLVNDPFFQRSGTLSGQLGKISDVTRTAQISGSKSADRFFFGIDNKAPKKKAVADTDNLLSTSKPAGGAVNTEHHDRIDRLRALVESKNA